MVQGCRRTDLYWLTGYRRKQNVVFFLKRLRDIAWFNMLKTIT